MNCCCSPNRSGRTRPVRGRWSRGVRSLWLGVLLVFPGCPLGWAQASNEVEVLKQQLRDLREQFERVQEEQRKQIETLTRRLEQLSGTNQAGSEQKKLEEELVAELGTN